MQIADVVWGLLVNGVFWFAFFKVPQCLCQMIIQNHCLMPKLSNEKVLLLDLFLKRQSSLKLLPR